MANLNKVKKYHFIYKTTNLLNNKYYVGMHSTSNLKDGYMGSGKQLRYSIRKYGVQNFKLEILEWFDSREALVEREKELVNEDLLKDEMCLNLKPGGSGGFCNDEHRIKAQTAGLKCMLGGIKGVEKRIWLLKNNSDWASYYKKCVSDGLKGNKNWTGKTHKEETKQKIGEANRIKQSGSSNSQFGTCWITNGTENKKIKKTDLIPDGWKVGRIIK